MIEFILTEANRPFAIAIAAMLMLGFLELLLAMGGFGMMGVLDKGRITEMGKAAQ